MKQLLNVTFIIFINKNSSHTYKCQFDLIRYDTESDPGFINKGPNLFPFLIAMLLFSCYCNQ